MTRPPLDIPPGTRVVHTVRGTGLRRFGRTTGPPVLDAARIWSVPVLLDDGTALAPVIGYPQCDTLALADPDDAGPAPPPPAQPEPAQLQLQL